MPKFELVPQVDAERISATGRRAEIMREYLGYVEQLGADQAGKLQATEGETPGAVRKRLGAAARLSGKDIVIKRAGEDVYFWVKSGAGGQGGRGGRACKASESSS